jgi:hypothetical protein
MFRFLFKLLGVLIILASSMLVITMTMRVDTALYTMALIAVACLVIIAWEESR